MKKDKVLIFGATGMLGKEVSKVFKKKYDIITCGRRKIDKAISKNHHCFDLMSLDIQKFMKDINPDIVIYCAGQTDIDFCENNKSLSYNINSKIPSQISKYSDRFVYVSTDCLFSINSLGDHLETKDTQATSYYSFTKKEGEALVLKNCNKSLIIRTNILGVESSGNKSIIDWLINQVRNNKEIYGFTDIVFNPVTVIQLAQTIEALLEKEMYGIINVGCDKNITKYQFIKDVIHFISKNKKHIIPDISSNHLAVERCKNTSLNTNKLESSIGKKIKYGDVLNCLEKQIKKYMQ